MVKLYLSDPSEFSSLSDHFFGGSIMADITIKEMIRSEQLQHQRKKKITFGPNHKIVI